MKASYAVENFPQWRTLARQLLAADVDPGDVDFTGQGGQSALGLALDLNSSTGSAPRLHVPPAFLSLAQTISLHRDSERWNLLYQLLWRLTHGERYLVTIASDKLMAHLYQMEKGVRRDLHKMKAFVRFREASDGVFVAWYKPDHLIVEHNAPFFKRRFGSMKWSILTPDRCAYWDRETLSFGPGLPRDAAPAEDEVEAMWLSYYGSIFNPARLNLRAMMSEMPAKHWSTLPEAALIQPLALAAGARVSTMALQQPPSAKPFLPQQFDLPAIREALPQCEGCELYQEATQVVCGEGSAEARMMIVGEQPGDQEDRTGRPFIGPAGEILTEALAAAQIPRDSLYVTNAVKHFHFEERGKRRIHKKPRAAHVAACRPWLEAEVAAVQPEVIVCLGATAALAILGREVRINAERGEWQTNRWDIPSLVTFHPAAILRAEGDLGKQQFDLLVDDLRKAWERLH